MQKIIYTIIFLFVIFSIQAQAQKKPYLIQLSGNYTNFQNIQPRLGYGLTMNGFWSDKFSSQYMLNFRANYFELSTSIISIPLLFAISGDDEEGTLQDLGAFIILFAISFENFAFHFPLNENFELSPSVSLLRLKYFFDEDAPDRKEYLTFSGSLGCQLNQKIGQYFNLGYFIEGSKLYTGNSPVGLNAGIRFGAYFPIKDK
ncbi:hypothetical protein ACFLTE_01565 [Bacteroidota bacterium]